MSAADFVIDVLFGLGQRAAKHTRKRAPGDEDHWYPRVPEAQGLLEDQCRWCLRVLEARPPRGCDANVLPKELLAGLRREQAEALAMRMKPVINARGRVIGWSRNWPR